MSFNRTAPTFASTLEDFTRGIHALRALIAHIEPQLSREVRRVLKDNLPWSLSTLVNVTRKQLFDLQKTANNAESENAERLTDAMSQLDRLSEHPALDNTDNTKADRQFAERAVRDAEDQVDFFFNGALTVLVGLAEEVVQQLVAQHYRNHPDTIPSLKDYPFTFTELSKFADLQAAREFLLERAVANKLRDDLNSSITFLKTSYSLDAKYLNVHLDYLTEIFQRRNLAVHNRGFVNHLYLSKVPREVSKDLRIGDKLRVERSYLTDAIDRIELCFTLLIADSWSRTQGSASAEAIAQSLNNLALENLSAERWVVAAGLSQFVMVDKNISGESALIAKLNYWQSKKWSGEYASVKQDVESFDVATRSERYKLAHAALTDNADSFFGLLRVALQRRLIHIIEAKHWPIFREMRKDERFKNIISRFERQTVEVSDTRRAFENIESIADSSEMNKAIETESLQRFIENNMG